MVVKRINLVKRSIIILFIFILLLLFASQLDWFWRLIYPLKYEDIIRSYSREHDLDPYLVSAVIFVESKFIPGAVSHKGAMGLMQIMPQTGNWIAEQLQYSDFEKAQLFNPEVNICFGTWYLNNLIKEFGNDPVIVLAAYNAGRGNVKKWLKEEWDGQHQSLEQLPYQETREYIKQILTVYSYYKRLYNLNNQSRLEYIISINR